jgi:hypothetical protein
VVLNGSNSPLGGNNGCVNGDQAFSLRVSPDLALLPQWERGNVIF